MVDPTGAQWRKSTRNGDNGGDCVQVADNLSGLVAVSDSKGPAAVDLDPLPFPP